MTMNILIQRAICFLYNPSPQALAIQVPPPPTEGNDYSTASKRLSTNVKFPKALAVCNLSD